MLLFLLSLFSAVFAQTVTDTPTPTLTPVLSLTPTQTLTPTAIPPTNTPTITPSPTPTVGPFKLTVVSVSSQIVKNTPFTVSVKLENTQVGTTYALKAYATNNTSLISTQNNLIWYGYTGAWASMPFVVGNGGLINTSLTARIEEIQLPSTLRVRANKNYSGTLAESDNTIAITTVLEPTLTPTNTPTPTATPTNAPAPTNTPTPTHTPTPTPTVTPSPTPLPTITDFPADTPAPTITPAYLIQTLDSNVLGAQDTAQLETKFMAEDSNPSTSEPEFNLTKFLPIILIVTGGLVLLVPLFLSILKKNA